MIRRNAGIPKLWPTGIEMPWFGCEPNQGSVLGTVRVAFHSIGSSPHSKSRHFFPSFISMQAMYEQKKKKWFEMVRNQNRSSVQVTVRFWVAKIVPGRNRTTPTCQGWSVIHSVESGKEL